MGRAIEAAEAEFKWCWAVVQYLKHPEIADEAVGADLVDFQFRLVEAIVGLEAIHRTVRAALKRLRRESKRYDRGWLGRQRAALELYQKALANTLAIGRAIGDGFAWCFYENDRRLIEQHLKHPKQADLPVGIGGLGERLLVRGIPGFDGKIAIYHGTTTFLRIGDVSFVHLPSRRVHAIAELKTKKISDGKYQLTLHLVSGSAEFMPRTTDFPKNRRPRSEPLEEPLRDAMQERLDIQKRRMSRAIVDARDKKPALRVGKLSNFYFKELADVVRRSTSSHFALTQAGPSLVIGALRLRNGRSFAADVIAGKGNINHLISEVPEWALKIMMPDRADNALIVGAPGFGDAALSVSAESLPPLWWPMDEDALADVLFGRVMLVTLYNPAPLRAAVEALGLFPEAGANAVSGMVRDRRISIGVFNHFDRLIQNSFMATESVLAMLEASIEAAFAHAEGSISVSLHAQVTTSDHAHENDQYPAV